MTNIKSVTDFKNSFIEEANKLYLRVSYFSTPLEIKLVISSSLSPRGKKRVNLNYSKDDIRKGRYDLGDVVDTLTRAYVRLA